MPHFDMGKILQMLPDLAVLAAVYVLPLIISIIGNVCSLAG
jgi:hypothetical protein